MKKNNNMAVDLLAFGVILFFIVGWVMNLAKLFSMDEVNVEFVLRVLGVITGFIGGVYGWF